MEGRVVRCVFQRAGWPQCGRDPVDARLVELPNGDRLVALLCEQHCRTYDSVMWAARERERKR